jgi:hypothetical protein
MNGLTVLEGGRRKRGSRGVPNTVTVRQTTLDDLVDEVSALTAEAMEFVDQALPMARQMAIIAKAFGPHAEEVGRELVELIARQSRRHPRRAA